ncbi:MAG: TetR/AcrR family transcriptional regulator [Myxococcota bacterium]|jgi:AcrR family transcriptional regulator|nr:TetR/AcrR family transcriptional regulator [Myxococcota bacterium]
MGTSRTESKGDASDGRVQRSLRSREAIVAALLELIGEGDRVPTAERVAERAGVGIRTVFRHFSDMDSLYATMSEWVEERVVEYMTEVPVGGSLEDRVHGFIDSRSTGFETVAPYFRSSAVLRWRSKFLESNYRGNLKSQRKRLLLFFPELKSASSDLVEAADCVTSIEAWIRMRSEQKLSFTRAKAVQTHLLLAVLAGVMERGIE